VILAITRAAHVAASTRYHKLASTMPRATPPSTEPRHDSSPFASSSSRHPQATNQPKASSSTLPSHHNKSTNGHDHAADVDMAQVGESSVDEEADILYLKPGAYPHGGRGKWKEQGRGILAAVSPVGGEVVSWISRPVSSVYREGLTAAYESSRLVIRTKHLNPHRQPAYLSPKEPFTSAPQQPSLCLS
jgi:hypothetical protein